jgi:hypothetical protein
MKNLLKVFIHTIDPTLESSLKKFHDLVAIMTSTNKLECLQNDSGDILHGCAFTLLSDKCKLYILLKVYKNSFKLDI